MNTLLQECFTEKLSETRFPNLAIFYRTANPQELQEIIEKAAKLALERQKQFYEWVSRKGYALHYPEGSGKSDWWIHIGNSYDPKTTEELYKIWEEESNGK